VFAKRCAWHATPARRSAFTHTHSLRSSRYLTCRSLANVVRVFLPLSAMSVKSSKMLSMWYFDVCSTELSASAASFLLFHSDIMFSIFMFTLERSFLSARLGPEIDWGVEGVGFCGIRGERVGWGFFFLESFRLMRWAGTRFLSWIEVIFLIWNFCEDFGAGRREVMELWVSMLIYDSNNGLMVFGCCKKTVAS